MPQGPRLPHRDFSEYKPDSNLLRDVTSPSQPGASHKGRLHLAVLGHVDAGKSTLVGRILHASGEISVQQVWASAPSHSSHLAEVLTSPWPYPQAVLLPL